MTESELKRLRERAEYKATLKASGDDVFPVPAEHVIWMLNRLDALELVNSRQSVLVSVESELDDALERIQAYDSVVERLRSAQDERNKRAALWADFARRRRAGMSDRDMRRERANLEGIVPVWDIGELVNDLLDVYGGRK